MLTTFSRHQCPNYVLMSKKKKNNILNVYFYLLLLRNTRYAIDLVHFFFVYLNVSEFVTHVLGTVLTAYFVSGNILTHNRHYSINYFPTNFKKRILCNIVLG